MHKLDDVKYIILTIGLFLLFIASILYYQSQHPFKDSLETSAQIIKISSPVTSDLKSTSTQDYLVQFRTLTDQTIELTLTASKPLPLIQLNDSVSLIYSASQPSKALLKPYPSFQSNISIWANIGSFLIVSFIIIHLKDFKKLKKIRHLQSKGIEIKTVLRSVELDQELEAKGQKSYRIYTEWLNPNATALHIFKSDYLLFDPSDMLEDNAVTVLIERDNPSEYYLDISFLAPNKKAPGFKW